MLGHHIQSVVFGSSKPEMLGAYTARIVTRVANVFPHGYRAVKFLKEKSMSQYPMHIRSLTDIEHSVAPIVDTSRPQPARVGLINLRPESINSSTPRPSFTLTGTESATASTYLGSFYHHAISARFANGVNGAVTVRGILTIITAKASESLAELTSSHVVELMAMLAAIFQMGVSHMPIITRNQLCSTP